MLISTRSKLTLWLTVLGAGLAGFYVQWENDQEDEALTFQLYVSLPLCLTEDQETVVEVYDPRGDTAYTWAQRDVSITGPGGLFQPPDSAKTFLKSGLKRIQDEPM